MNYVPVLNPTCDSCGARLTIGDGDCDGAREQGVCEQCWLDSEAKAEAAQHTQAVSDFRWFSREWFRGNAERERYRWAEGYFGFQRRAAT
jgi:hypothetical protein